MSRALQRIARTSTSPQRTRDSNVPSRLARRAEPGGFVQRLQQSAGNQAAAKWLRGRSIQASPTVGPSDDAYEREADRVADRVLRMPGSPSALAIQQVQPASERGSGPPDVSPGLESYLDASRGGGERLPSTALNYFGTRFGHDFSGVRVHTGSGAARAAAGISAQAFTAGESIHFAAGRFRPGTPAGDRLLAHELTHVVQQSGGTAARPQLRRLQRHSGQPPGPPDPFPAPDFDCSIDLQAGKLQDFLDCCAKTPLGHGCLQDVINGLCKIPGLKCGDKPKAEDKCPPGFKAGATREHKGECCKVGSPDENARSCCSADRIVESALDPRCCPAGTFPDAARKACVSLVPPVPPSPCLPGQLTSKGECCVLPLIPRGEACVLPPPPPPPPRPLPSPIEVFFRKDKPSLKAAGASAGDNLTAEGNANFQKLVAVLRGNPDLKVQLVGRASPEGSEEYNLALGRRRAELIAAALEGEGVDPVRIADPPEAELRSECQSVRGGVFTCGEAGAAGPGDRQVLARVFRPGP